MGVGLDHNIWTNMNPAIHPSNRIGHRMAYDSGSDRIVLFGGLTEVGGIRNDETWIYDFDTNTWTRTTPPATPGAGLSSWIFPGVVVAVVVVAAIAGAVLWRRRKLPRSPPHQS